MSDLTVNERWAKPVNFLGAEHDDQVVTLPDGRTVQDARVFADNDSLERMKEGRVCFGCYEPLEQPWPEVHESIPAKLPDGATIQVPCGYECKKNKGADLRKLDMTLAHLGSRVNVNDEIERLTELTEYERRTGIKLPDSVKFPNETR